MKKTIALISVPTAFAMSMALLTGCQVVRGERTVSQYSEDSSITSKVKYRLAKSDEVSNSRVRVETDKGVVLLSGFVVSDHQKAVAAQIAKSVSGVKAVKNNLVTEKEAHSNDSYNKAKRALTYE